jgi:hypothetical protein
LCPASHDFYAPLEGVEAHFFWGRIFEKCGQIAYKMNERGIAAHEDSSRGDSHETHTPNLQSLLVKVRAAGQYEFTVVCRHVIDEISVVGQPFDIFVGNASRDPTSASRDRSPDFDVLVFDWPDDIPKYLLCQRLPRFLLQSIANLRFLYVGRWGHVPTTNRRWWSGITFAKGWRMSVIVEVD